MARRRPRAGLVGLVSAVLVAGVLGTGGLGAGAAVNAPAPAPAPVAVVPPGAGSIMPGIDSRLLGVPLLPEAGPDASADLAAAQTELATLDSEQATLKARLEVLGQSALKLSAVQQEAAATLARSQALVDRVAAAAYRGATDELLAVLPSGNALDLGRRMKLAGEVGTSLRAISREARAARRRAGQAAQRTADETTQVQQRLGELEREVPTAARAVQARLAQAKSDLPARKIAASGIPVAAMDAYLRAARIVAVSTPTCGLEWWVLAGIADGESGHGTHNGARADFNGDVFPAIIGIPLDGTNSTQAVPDTDKGLLDTDPVWDRAVGVLQFIPGTWNRWASDGNFDGKTDPQNLYDASLGAARKLCADAGPEGMHTDAQIAKALKPYAVTAALVQAKLARAREYQVQGLPAPDASVAGVITPG
ncbi:MAG: hypothetical protein ACXVKQ_09780 [Acidimicrobiia bacterium]